MIGKDNGSNNSLFLSCQMGLSDGAFFMIKHTPLPNGNHPILSPICPMGVADTLELGCVSFGALSKDQILWEGHNIPKKSPNLYNFCGLLRISELLIILKTLAVVAFHLPRIRPRKWFALRQDFFNERGTQREFLKITSKALILSKRLGNYGINRVKFVSS